MRRRDRLGLLQQGRFLQRAPSECQPERRVFRMRAADHTRGHHFSSGFTTARRVSGTRPFVIACAPRPSGRSSGAESCPIKNRSHTASASGITCRCDAPSPRARADRGETGRARLPLRTRRCYRGATFPAVTLAIATGPARAPRKRRRFLLVSIYKSRYNAGLRP